MNDFNQRFKVFDIIPPEGKKTVRKAAGFPKEKKMAETKIPKLEDQILQEEKQEPTETVDSFLQKLASEKQTASKSWKEGNSSKKLRNFILVASLLLLVIGAGIWFGGINLSRARIVLVVERAFSPFSFEATFDAKLQSPDFSLRRLPIQLFKKSISLTKDFPATGKGEVSSKARGKVTIYNNYSSTNQILIANTRLQSPDGKIFRLTSRVVVPGNGKVVAEVIADKPGPEYNIGPTRFTFPAFREQGMKERYEKIYAESKEAFFGGASGSTKIITEQDIRLAQTSLSEEALSSLNKEIRQALPDGFILLEHGSIRFTVSNISSNLKAGDAAEAFSATINASIEALAFDERQVKELARRELKNDQLLEDLANAQFELAYTVSKPADFDSGTIGLKVDGSINIAKSLDVAKIKQSLAGKRKNEVQRELMAVPGIKAARVALWPRWVQSIPKDIERIEIAIE